MRNSKALPHLLIAVILAAGIAGCKSKEQEDPRTLPDFVRVAKVRVAEGGDHTYTALIL